MHVNKLYNHPHGNHVLASLIDSLPAASLEPFIAWLGRNTGKVARNQFGCSILERLFKTSYGHTDGKPPECADDGKQVAQMSEDTDDGVQKGKLSEDLLCEVCDNVACEAEALSKHQYGNYVLQQLFKHGSAQRVDALVDKLENQLPQLATHKHGSFCVQAAIKDCSADTFDKIFDALLGTKGSESLFGTWQGSGKRSGDAVKEALKAKANREQLLLLLESRLDYMVKYLELDPRRELPAQVRDGIMHKVKETITWKEQSLTREALDGKIAELDTFMPAS